ncbi:chorismate mutase [Crossiella equi]|uniref:chorismate mutase n=1 Tax=Crossiella equi TaxID=130796 RepID=A0ABS5A6P1_9PSEU|nr:chorismate mutase [Crossiella equi]MBP2472259.1 chorismate mutase [Crossiella equi]
MRTPIRLAAVLTALAAALVTAPAASASPTSLWQLTDLAAQRIQIADRVAAAKYGTTAPIDDPVREKQIYDSVAAQAPGLRLTPEDAVRFFRAQIESNKVVQRGLYAHWDANPSEAPTTRPDLAQIRPKIDKINAGMLTELSETLRIRTSHTCPTRQLVATKVATVTHRFDALHTRALHGATAATCLPA